MHLPDGIVPLNQAIIYWIISAVVLCLFFYKFSKDENKERRIVSTAILSIVSIVVTSISVPSPFGGVPLHFFIIPLVAILLGPLNGSIVSFLTLSFQGLLLGMGGITVLGANFIVMGLILSIVTYGFYKIFIEVNKTIAIFGSTVIGIIFATIGQIIELLLTGAMNFEVLVATLIPFYLFIGIIEGFSNVIIISSIQTIKPELIEIEKI